jgi:DNA-binding transcriptional MocR family regulator
MDGSPRARLPSWQDQAARLGVSHGTVRVAYARLIAEQFAMGSRAGRNACGRAAVRILNTRLVAGNRASAGLLLRVRKRAADRQRKTPPDGDHQRAGSNLEATFP